MKHTIKSLSLSVVAALVVLLTSSCNSVTQVAQPKVAMTVKQARKALVGSLSHIFSEVDPREVKFSRKSVTFKTTGTYDTSAGKTFPQKIVFAQMKDLSIEADLRALTGVDVTDIFIGGQLYQRFATHAAAEAFIDAVLTLREAALAPSTEEADFAAFALDAENWLAAIPKPTMTNEVRTYKLLAEDAFKRKDFEGSLEAYTTALDRFPMWPEGHYNAALLAGEAEDYELAAKHMRRYLVLAPKAKDAAAAQDKLLLWQHKEEGPMARIPPPVPPSR